MCCFVFDYIFDVPWATFTLFVPVETDMNTSQFTYLMARWRHNCATGERHKIATVICSSRRPWLTASWNGRNFRRKWSNVCLFQFLLENSLSVFGQKSFTFHGFFKNQTLSSELGMCHSEKWLDEVIFHDKRSEHLWRHQTIKYSYAGCRVGLYRVGQQTWPFLKVYKSCVWWRSRRKS